MDVAGAAEGIVFEMVRLEVGDAVRHIFLAGQKWLLPQDLSVAADAARPTDVAGQFADQQLGAECRLAQLGMCQPQIIVPLGDMIAELVGQREAQAPDCRVVTNEVDTRKLGLLAAVEREIGDRERLLRTNQRAAVALVEPFGLYTRLARAWFAAFNTFQENAHRIRLNAGRGRRLVHRVTPLGRAEVG